MALKDCCRIARLIVNICLFDLSAGRHNDNADMDISGDSTPTSEASYSLSGTPTTHGGSVGGGMQSSEQSSLMPQGGLCNALPRLASHPNTGAVVTPIGAHYGAIGVGGTGGGSGGGGGGGGGPVSGATMLPTSGLASVPSNIANSSNSSLRNSVVGHIGSTSSVSFGQRFAFSMEYPLLIVCVCVCVFPLNRRQCRRLRIRIII